MVFGRPSAALIGSEPEIPDSFFGVLFSARRSRGAQVGVAVVMRGRAPDRARTSERDFPLGHAISQPGPPLYSLSMKIDQDGPVSHVSRPVGWSAKGARHDRFIYSHSGRTAHLRRYWWHPGASAVIVCSCNVLSDSQIRTAIASATPRARIRHVYASLCCAAKCGRCARTIKAILDDHIVATEGAAAS